MMQVTLKQNEITAAIAAYLTNVLGVKNVSPETLSVTYKQGRSDKNGMTAELEIEAPAYVKTEALGSKTPNAPAPVEVEDNGQVLLNETAVGQASIDGGVLGNAQSLQTPTEATSASGAQAPEHVQAEAVAEQEPVEQVDPAAPVYEGERRSEEREEPVNTSPEVQPEPEFNREDRVAELNDEVAQALAEDKAAEEAEPAATPKPLFG